MRKFSSFSGLEWFYVILFVLVIMSLCMAFIGNGATLSCNENSDLDTIRTIGTIGVMVQTL